MELHIGIYYILFGYLFILYLYCCKFGNFLFINDTITKNNLKYIINNSKPTQPTLAGIAQLIDQKYIREDDIDNPKFQKKDRAEIEYKKGEIAKRKHKFRNHAHKFLECLEKMLKNHEKYNIDNEFIESQKLVLSNPWLTNKDSNTKPKDSATLKKYNKHCKRFVILSLIQATKDFIAEKRSVKNYAICFVGEHDKYNK